MVENGTGGSGLRRLGAPVFEEDEAKTRAAGLLNAVLLFNLAMMIVGVLVMPLITVVPLRGMLIIGALAVPVAGSYVLLRLGRVRLAGWVFSLASWGFHTVLLALSGGLYGPVAAGYLVLLVLVGLVLGRRAVMIFTGLVVLAGAASLVTEAAGVLPERTMLIDAMAALQLFLANVGQVAGMLWVGIKR